MEQHQLTLNRSFQNIELAIVEAIHVLAPFSEYKDDSCRCKEIHNLVKNATIEINGVLQQGNHRFTLFSSALCGRRSSQKLFQRVTDPDRVGAWWKLKVPYQEAVQIASSLHSRHATKLTDSDEQRLSPEVHVNREEFVRMKFLSLVPLATMGNEVRDLNARLEERNAELTRIVQLCRSEASPATLQMLDEYKRLRKHIESVNQRRGTGNEQRMSFFQ